MRRGAIYLAVLLMGAGFTLIWLGWNGAAEQDCVQCQVPYLISGGLGGLGLIVVGATLAVVHEVRRTAAARGDAPRAHPAPPPGGSAGEPAPRSARDAPGRDDATAAGAGTVLATRSAYHAAGCRLIADTPTETITPAAAAERGLRPCHVCEPRARSA